MLEERFGFFFSLISTPQAMHLLLCLDMIKRCITVNLSLSLDETRNGWMYHSTVFRKKYTSADRCFNLYFLLFWCIFLKLFTKTTFHLIQDEHCFFECHFSGKYFQTAIKFEQNNIIGNDEFGIFSINLLFHS